MIYTACDVFLSKKREHLYAKLTGLICNIRLSAPGTRLICRDLNNGKFEMGNCPASVKNLKDNGKEKAR